jgi:hypothetical protein
MERWQRLSQMAQSCRKRATTQDEIAKQYEWNNLSIGNDQTTTNKDLSRL